MGQHYNQCEIEARNIRLVKYGISYNHDGFYKIVITEEVPVNVPPTEELYTFVKKCIFNYSIN